MHKCKINEKVYIGKTNNIERRWRSNGIEYKPKKHNTRPFWNAIQKYGWDNFEHIILEDGLTNEEANERERYYIKKYNSRDRKCGYNVAEGGDGGIVYKEHPKGMIGKHHTEEWKEKHSKQIKDLAEQGVYKDMWKTHEHPKGMLGKHHSEEYKEKLRNRPSHEHPSHKKVRVIYPNGESIDFDCVKYAQEYLGISAHVISQIIKSGQPYEIKGNMRKDILEKYKKIVGIRIIVIEDTEITDDIKRLSAL